MLKYLDIQIIPPWGNYDMLLFLAKKAWILHINAVFIYRGPAISTNQCLPTVLDMSCQQIVLQNVAGLHMSSAIQNFVQNYAHPNANLCPNETCLRYGACNLVTEVLAWVSFEPHMDISSSPSNLNDPTFSRRVKVTGRSRRNISWYWKIVHFTQVISHCTQITLSY